MKVFIAADHGGFELKEALVGFLSMSGAPVVDLGPKSYDTSDDYPDFAIAVAKEVVKNSENRGILICRNGVGMSMVVNKFNGIRATLSFNPEHAASSRIHDDSNVLALPADYMEKEMAIKTISSWLGTDFEAKERRIRRLEKVKGLGQKL